MTPTRPIVALINTWLPDHSAVQLLEQAVEQAGWHHYFEQVNARGALQTPEPIIGHMINL